MSMEKEMNEMYRKLAETVNEMIPEEWKRFYFYAQISEDGGGTYFFYNTPENENNYIYSLEVPLRYEIDEDKFEDKDDHLYKLSKDLRDVFKKHLQEPWYSFTMSLGSNGQFNMHFDYTNWFETDYSFSDQMVIWKNKYLGDIPINKNDQALIEKYHKDFPSDPI